MGLLKGLDPLLSADLLYVLRLAGHGDEILICDANFPAHEVSTKTTTQKLIALAGADTTQVAKAITSVLPLDYFASECAWCMAPQDGVLLPPLGIEVHEGFRSVLAESGNAGICVEPIERFAFYSRARDCFAVVQAQSERRPYGNFILKKGVVGPDGKDLKP
eukprot:TRINITY_DN50614_c0_g1_i1.p1 TRINITY_DN50614_c0_g1~~TRINITY_DN50614_c0_g1_i1.p1  ORF type:complete len:162 (-),score=19.81 TRINITY_DN50614_c0_g1_i1:42-527(-)